MSKQRAKRRRTPDNELDALLFDILANIAAILIASGYGFSRVNELTKSAFVRAARSIDPGCSPKLSIARVAALTGLTRMDVSKILRTPEGELAYFGRPTNRIARVAVGWKTDKNFLGRDDKPRPLGFSGAGNTFSALVRRYSGDIPPKAMLKEMRRLDLIDQHANGQVHLLRTDVTPSRRTSDALKAVVPWTRFLANASTIYGGNELTSRSNRFELKFSSLPQVFAAMRELQRRHSAFVSALEQMNSRTSEEKGYSINISVAVAATNPRVSNSPRSARPAKKRRRVNS